MTHLLWLLCIVSSVQYVTSQITMVESGPGTVKPSETLELTCKVTGASLTDSTNMYCVNWVRQSDRKPLVWLGQICYNAATYYASSLQGRLTLTRDTNKGEVFLKLTGMKPEESATYYCARYSGGYYFDIWGQGTKVTVTSAQPNGPTLFPLISSGTSQGMTTIGCLAKDFLPDSIDFSWVDQVSNNYTNGFKKYNSVLQSGGTYTACSQIKVPTQGWENSDSYYCSAKHLDTVQSVVIGIPKVIGKPPSTVSIHPPMQGDIEINGNGTAICLASGFSPNSIQMLWKKNSEGIREVITEEPVSIGNGLFKIASYIVVTKQDWDSDATFSCIVKHDPSDFQETKNVSKSSLCEPDPCDGKIKVTAVPPSFETIYMQNTAPLTCIITNIANKDGLEVTWYADNERINTEIEDPTYDISIRRYTARAIATVCPEDWKTKTFKCSVSHPELPSVEVVTIKKPNGNDAKAPTVLLYPPHPDELAKRESATMSCLVKGFNPPDIFVKWIDSDNKELPNVVTTGPVQEITSSSKKTYTLLSTLTLPSVQDWNSGKSYTCIVGHEALPLQTTQRTIDKTSGKPSNVNVSLVLSDSC